MIWIIATIGILEAIVIRILQLKLMSETKQTDYTLEILTDALNALKTIKEEKEIPIYSYLSKIEEFSITSGIKNGEEMKCLKVKCKE